MNERLFNHKMRALDTWKGQEWLFAWSWSVCIVFSWLAGWFEASARFCKTGSQESPTGPLAFQTKHLQSRVQTDTVGQFVKLCVVLRSRRIPLDVLWQRSKPLNSLWSPVACGISGCPFPNRQCRQTKMESHWNSINVFFLLPHIPLPPSHPSPAPHLSVPGWLQAEDRSVHCAERAWQQLHALQVGHQRERHGGHGSQDAGEGPTNQL